MTNNDILAEIRHALQLDDDALVLIFRESGREVGQSTIAAFLTPEGEDGYIPCADPILGMFLDGLIIHRRGRREGQPAPQPVRRLTRNDVVKKLRIALDLKEDDLLAVFRAAGLEVSRNDLSAIFRKEGNRHYKECCEAMLKAFLKGVALYCRG